MAEKPSKPKVVIVGAGVAGCKLALKLLAKKREFLLINPTNYFHLNFAAVRAIAVPEFAEKTLIPLSVFGDQFKQGKVVKIETSASERGGKVFLESGEEIQYGYLIIATGTTTKWPIKLHGIPKETASSQYKELIEKVKAAKKIVIIGGGTTGVESAAELSTEYPDKEVTLVHGSTSLLTDGLRDQHQQLLQNHLTNDFHIKLVLGERVSNLADLEEGQAGTVVTEKGTELEADIIFKFIGLKVNTEAYKDGLESAMNENGSLKVNNRFRVEGYPDVYALGDCTDLPEPKNGAYAIKHGEVMAKSIFQLDKGCCGEAEYKPDGLPILVGVSLGPNSAFTRTKGGWKIPVFIVKKLKCKHLFTDIWWKDMKQKCP